MTLVGDIAIKVMKEENSSVIGYNEYGMLAEVFSRAMEKGIIKEIGSRGGRNRPHPLNRHIAILNYLENDKRFSKFFIRCTTGRSEQLVREFELKAKIQASEIK
jgi:hypothetical protein